MADRSTTNDRLRSWADSGAMSLCGRPGRPALGPPEPLVGVLDEVARRIARRSEALGRAVRIDPLAVLTERAAIAGLTRRGSTSCGGASRLVPTADGVLAVTLARPEDLELLAAWLGLDVAPAATDAWTIVEARATARTAAELAERAAVLGLPAAVVGSVTRADGPPVLRTELGTAPARDLQGLTVVDLSSLWAGPLCGRILSDAGARVVKVESSARPDGARRGPSEFFDLMNAGKESVAVDFGSAAGREALRCLVSGADVVIESSRPRALEALGLDASALTAVGPTVWLSITGHGRTGEGWNRAGFGDDTAAAGGLLVHDGDRPCFAGDAIADPITGMFAVLAVLDSVAEGGRWLLDAALARAAAAASGPTLDASGLRPLPPVRPSGRGRARMLGADTAVVLEELCR